MPLKDLNVNRFNPERSAALLYEMLNDINETPSITALSESLREGGLLNQNIFSNLLSLSPSTVYEISCLDDSQKISTKKATDYSTSAHLLITLTTLLTELKAREANLNIEQVQLLFFLNYKYQDFLMSLATLGRVKGNDSLTHKILDEAIDKEAFGDAREALGERVNNYLASQNSGRQKGKETLQIVIEQWEKYTGDKATATKFASILCENTDPDGTVLFLVDVEEKEEVDGESKRTTRLACQPWSQKTVKKHINAYKRSQETKKQK